MTNVIQLNTFKTKPLEHHTGHFSALIDSFLTSSNDCQILSREVNHLTGTHTVVFRDCSTGVHYKRTLEPI